MCGMMLYESGWDKVSWASYLREKLLADAMTVGVMNKNSRGVLPRSPSWCRSHVTGGEARGSEEACN